MPGVEKWEGRNSRRTKLRVVHTSKIVRSHKRKTRGDRYCTADKKIWIEATRKKLGGREVDTKRARPNKSRLAGSSSTTLFFFTSHIHWIEQFPDDDSPRLRLPIVIILLVFLSLDATVGTGAAVSGTVTHDALGSLASSATTAAPASTNDDDVVAADGSTRAARLAAEDVLLLVVFPVAATTACRLRKLFDCGDCDACDCGELAHDEPMLDIDWGRLFFAACCWGGSRWRVRIIDNLRRMMLPSGIRGVSETDELEFVGSGDIDARERLNGERTLYATGGCGCGWAGEVVGES